MAPHNASNQPTSPDRGADACGATHRDPKSEAYVPLVVMGVILQLLLLVMYSTAPKLDWYSSRLGPPSEWLDQHLYPLIRPLFQVDIDMRGIMPVLVYLLMLTAMFAIYVLAIRHAWRSGAGSRTSFYIVFGLSTLLSISLLLQPYLSSQDIFSYAFYAHISTLYGGNPYTAVPQDFPFDPLFEAIFWKDQPSNYGPLWNFATDFVTLLTGTNTALTLVGIKLIVTAFSIGCIPLVWKILGRTTPRMRLAGTVLYAWNPLLILETAGSGHNDAVLGFFVTLGLFLYVRNNKASGFAAIVLSVLTKYVTAVLLPLYLVLWLRDSNNTRERLLVVGKCIALTAAFLVVSYVPLYSGPATFQVASFGTDSSAYTNSPMELIFREIRVALGDSRDVASLPLLDRAWWVTTKSPTPLRSKPDATASNTIGLPASTILMVIEPRQGSWLHVYAPLLDRFGYVLEAVTTPAPAPNLPGNAGTASALSQASSHGTNAERANLILRAIAGAIFLLLFLHFLWRTRTYNELIYFSLTSLFASYWLLETWFWPWYLLWALPLSALVPHRRITELLLAFSFTALGLHARMDTGSLPYIDAIYEYRSLAVFGLPILLVGIYLALSRLHRSSTSTPFMSTRRLRILVGIVATLTVLVLAGFTGYLTYPKESQQILPQSEARSTERDANPAEYYWNGVGFYEEDQYQEAIDSLTKAIQARSDYTEAYRVRYMAYLHMRKFDEAIQDISTVLANKGDAIHLLLARGNAYQQTHRSELALQDYASAIRLDPSNPLAYRFQAQVYHELGLVNEAIASQQQAILLSPYSALLYRELAEMHATLGHFEYALALYNVSISLDKDDVESYVGRASILRILGRAEETIADLQEVLVLSNDEDLRSWARRRIAAVTGSKAMTPGNDAWQSP